MKKALLVFSWMAVLTGCQTAGDNRTVEQKPQFGQPESSIPWNKPEQWEQAGALGSVPGIGEGH